MNERKQFEADLLQAVRDMKAGKAVRAAHVAVSEISMARTKAGLTQSEFAKLLGVSVPTLQEWEQGRRTPSGAAKTLIQIAIQHPEALKNLKAA